MKKQAKTTKPSIPLEQRGRKWLQNTTAAAPKLFLEKYRVVAVLLLLLSAAVSGWVVWTFLFTEAEESLQAAPPKEERLNTRLVDELELWLEERQTAYENPPVMPRRVFGD